MFLVKTLFAMRALLIPAELHTFMRTNQGSLSLFGTVFRLVSSELKWLLATSEASTSILWMNSWSQAVFGLFPSFETMFSNGVDDLSTTKFMLVKA